MKKFLLYIVLSLSVFPITSFAQSGVMFYITGNLQTYDFKECVNIQKSLSLTYKGTQIANTTLTYDTFAESERKALGRFSFYVELPQQELQFEDYDIVTSENVYNLQDFRQKTRIVQNNTILVPDITLFCNKDKLETIIDQAYQQDLNQGVKGTMGPGTQQVQQNIVNKLSISGNLENINIEIKDSNNQVIFTRKDLTIPYSTEDKEILGEFSTQSYSIIISKQGYTQQKFVRSIVDSNLEIDFSLSKTLSTHIIDESQFVNQEQQIDNQQTHTNSQTKPVTGGQEQQIDNQQGTFKDYVIYRLVNQDKNKTYKIIVDGKDIQQEKQYQTTNLQQKVQVFEDNKLVVEKQVYGKGIVEIDIGEYTKNSYIIWVISLGLIVFGVVIYLLKRQRKNISKM